MTAVQERVGDQSVLKLLRAMLRAGVMESGVVHHPDTGTPQGGVVSPLMCNVYLHRLDRAWDTSAYGVLVRFADDLLVVCKSRQQAQAALTRLRELLADLGLAPKEAKTRIVELAVGGEGFDFLGFHHRMVRSRGTRGRRGVAFLARWPSDRAMRRARDRITELTVRSRLRLPVEEVVKLLTGCGAARIGRCGDCGEVQGLPVSDRGHRARGVAVSPFCAEPARRRGADVGPRCHAHLRDDPLLVCQVRAGLRQQAASAPTPSRRQVAPR